MAKLANSRHEAFAWQIARGVAATAAYRKAGYEDGNSGRLATQNDIILRVAEIREVIAKRSEVSAVWLVERLKKVAESKVEETRDRLKAMELIGKSIGAFEHTKRVEHSGSVLQEHVDLTGLEAGDFQRMREIVEKARNGQRAD